MHEVPQNPKERVLIHGGSLLTNGITAMVKSTIKAIDKSKYSVAITLHDSTIDFPDRMRHLDEISLMADIIPITGARNDDSSDESVQYRKEFKRIFGNSKFDYVIEFSGNSAFFSKLFSFGPQDGEYKTIYLHNDLYSESQIRLPALEEVFQQYHLFDKALSVSEPTHRLNKTNISQNFGVDPNIFDYVNNIQDAESIIRKSHAPIDTGDMKFFERGTTFITMGRLSPEKGHEKLIRVFAKFVKNNPRNQLIILGEGPLEHALTTLINNLGVKKYVHLVGVKENPYPYLLAADCFVLPSDYEGQPTVLFEAMILRKPIIATDIVANRGVISKGYGTLVENSEAGLTDGILRYIRGVVEVGEFDVDAYNAEALNIFYEKVLNGKSRKDSK